MSEEWGPWIEHDASGFPNAVKGRFIEVVSLNLDDAEICETGFMPATLPKTALLCWTGGGWFRRTNYAMPIVRYRIRKSRGLEILEDILADLPAPSKERAGA